MHQMVVQKIKIKNKNYLPFKNIFHLVRLAIVQLTKISICTTNNNNNPTNKIIIKYLMQGVL